MINGISIHAPTKGATDVLGMIVDEVQDFNPRSHEGSDADRVALDATFREFQSTLPRRERLLRS